MSSYETPTSVKYVTETKSDLLSVDKPSSAAIEYNCFSYRLITEGIYYRRRKNVLVFSKREKTGGETRCNRNVRKKEVKKEENGLELPNVGETIRLQNVSFSPNANQFQRFDSTRLR